MTSGPGFFTDIPTERTNVIIASPISHYWDKVRTSLWFVPSLLVLAALGLAATTPAIDRVIPHTWINDTPLLFSGQADGARAVLTTVATATIGVAGVVFSMTIVSLQLASSQFGPRLLRTYLRDRSNQLVLGTFLATFLYCIVVLPTVNATDESAFVPHVAVTISVLLAITCLAMLVYYIDHIAQSIHADAVIDSVSRELEDVIDDLFPEEIGQAVDANNTPEEPSLKHHTESVSIDSTGSGYIRFINGDKLLAVAEAEDLFVHVLRPPESFVRQGDAIAEVWLAKYIEDEVADAIRSSIALGAHRTTLQDVLFTFEQAAEIAMRAMSPGINDPTTAMHCIDRIGDGIARLVKRQFPSMWRADRSGQVRIRIDPIGLDEILDSTVIAISRTAGVHLQVWLRLIEGLENAARCAKREEDAELMRACAHRLAKQAESELPCSQDQQRMAEAAAWAQQTD